MPKTAPDPHLRRVQRRRARRDEGARRRTARRRQEGREEGRRSGRGPRGHRQDGAPDNQQGLPRARARDRHRDAAPDLQPKTWYGMPASSDEDGKVVVFFKDAGKFSQRYSTIGFEEAASASTTATCG